MATTSAISTAQKLTEADLLQLIAGALDVSPNQLKLDTQARDIPEWDSMGILSILSALDRERIACDMGDAASLQSVQGVVKVVQSAGRLR